MASFEITFYLFIVGGNGLLLLKDGRCGLEVCFHNDRIAIGNTSQHTAGVIGRKSVHCDLIIVLAAFEVGRGNTIAYLYRFGCIDTHHRFCKYSIEFVVERFS